jgi:hypothetical protein
MRGDRDAALAMHGVDGVGGPLHEADGGRDAGGDQVVARPDDFLADQHDGTAHHARKPLPHVRVPRFVVRRDGERVESLALGFEDQSPGRQRAIAPHRAVGVEIDGEDAIAAERERRVAPRPIGERASDDRGGHEHARDCPRDHGTIRPTISGHTAMPKK